MGYELRDWRFSKHGTSWVAKGSDSTLDFVNDVALIGAGLLPSEGGGVQLTYLAAEGRHT